VALSGLGSARRPEELGLAHDRIVLSAKVSGVQDLIAIYRDLAGALRLSAAPRSHEAGMGSKGSWRSDRRHVGAAAGSIGDTIRCP